MSKYRELLSNKNFLFLWLGQIASQWGDRLGQMALIAFIYERSPGSPMAMAKILSITIIPVFIIGPLAGVYVDRWDRRRTMYISDLIRAALFLLIPVWFIYFKTLIPLYLVIFLVFSIGRFFVPAKMAIIPDLVDKKDLLVANSLVNIAAMIAALLGLGIGGILVEWWGARSGFYLDAGSFFISASLIFCIGIRALPFKRERIASASLKFVGSISKSVFAEIKEGIIYLTKLKEVVFTTKVLFILWSALGAISAVIIVFVQETLQSATKYLGFLTLFLVLGVILGSYIYGKFGKRINLGQTLFLSLSATGLALICFAIGLEKFSSFGLATVLASALGFFVSPLIIIGSTLVHQASSDEMRGKVFSSLEVVCHLAFLIFMIISAKLAESGLVEKFLILVGVGCILFVLGISNLIRKEKIEWQS